LNKNIFEIITFCKLKERVTRTGIKEFRDSSNIGYMHDKKQAIQLVLDNACDMHEDGFFPYALVSEAPEGIYGIRHVLPMKDRLTWFSWDNESNGYIIIDKCPPDLDDKYFN
jgi:hypothetical protein